MLQIALVQMDSKWQDVGYNLSLLRRLIEEYRADVFVLPEMFATGFQTSELVEATFQEDIIGYCGELAKAKSASITFSLAYQLKTGRMTNRLIWIKPNGEIHHYDKRHLFSLGEENTFFSQGKERLQLSFSGVVFCPLICYDLRFPVWSRNTDSYDILIYVANWPEARIAAWKSLLVARAIENQCYVIGVNRIGTDGQGIGYNGQSMFIGPSGKILHCSEDQTNLVSIVNVDMDVLSAFRRRYPFLEDRDHFILSEK